MVKVLPAATVCPKAPVIPFPPLANKSYCFAIAFALGILIVTPVFATSVVAVPLLIIKTRMTLLASFTAHALIFGLEVYCGVALIICAPF